MTRVHRKRGECSSRHRGEEGSGQELGGVTVCSPHRETQGAASGLEMVPPQVLWWERE